MRKETNPETQDHSLMDADDESPVSQVLLVLPQGSVVDEVTCVVLVLLVDRLRDHLRTEEDYYERHCHNERRSY